ncbi:MAG: ABC transporter ATP-binding protein [Candidatus Eremiobacteraeota bacterium]|nr:ABC transporter ATP-binding protein [Candidatus Eremiobacteraeota bacterium]
MSPLLEVRGLQAGYGRLAVLHGVSLEVHEREIVAVLGPNGAGKSTLLRAITGFDATVTAGEIVFDGRAIAGAGPEVLVRAGLVHVPEGRQLFSELSVDDNLRLGAIVKPRASLERKLNEAYERFPALAGRRSATAFSLSGGEQQMLAIARALMAEPRLLLMDEPSTGLAPQIAASIFETISELRAAGTSIVLVEQNAFQALARADRAYVLENGEIALQGSAADLAQDERVQSVYLGGAIESA